MSTLFYRKKRYDTQVHVLLNFEHDLKFAKFIIKYTTNSFPPWSIQKEFLNRWLVRALGKI